MHVTYLWRSEDNFGNSSFLPSCGSQIWVLRLGGKLKRSFYKFTPCCKAQTLSICTNWPNSSAYRRTHQRRGATPQQRQATQTHSYTYRESSPASTTLTSNVAHKPRTSLKMIQLSCLLFTHLLKPNIGLSTQEAHGPKNMWMSALPPYPCTSHLWIHKQECPQ